MPRLKEVTRADAASDLVLTTYDRVFGPEHPVEGAPSKAGLPGNWWTVYALEPDLFKLMLDRQEWQWAEGRQIDPVLRELGITRAGWNVGSQFVYSQHCKFLRKIGVSEEKIAAIPSWSSATCFSEIERAALGYADDLVLGNGRSSDARFADLKKELSDVAILELTFVICTYQTSAIMARALRLEWDDRDDPIVEVAPTKQ